MTEELELVDFLEYHQANGHANMNSLKIKAENQNLKIINVIDCKTCKDHQLMINFINTNKPLSTSHHILEIIHFFVSPPFPITSLRGATQFLLVVDDYSKMMFIYPIKHKSDLISLFFKFTCYCERFKQDAIRKIVTSDVVEFDHERIQNFVHKRNIKHDKLNVNQKNTFIDYHAKYIQVMLKLLMADAKDLNANLWGEAIKTAVYIFNYLPNESLKWKAPADKWLDHSLVSLIIYY